MPTRARGTRGWVQVGDLIARAGAQADPAGQAQLLRAAGADVTRNSRAQWIVNPGDPVVRRWAGELAAAARQAAPGILPDSAYLED